MSKITQIYNEYVDIVRSDMPQAKKSAQDMLDYILNSTAKYHGRCVKSLHVPKLITDEEVELFKNLVTTLYGIFDKVIAEYMVNSEYRKLFGFDKRLEELIMRKPVYSSNIPIARVDIFLDENTHDFKFCEFNTDGTSAMNEDRELCKAVAVTQAFRKFTEKHRVRTFELFDSWVDAATDIYRDYCSRKNIVAHKATVCITDFMESATENEFNIFREAFENAGYNAYVCEIRELRHHDGKLYTPDGHVIDIVYRRAVTSDIMAHYDEVTQFIDAVKEEDVCLLGDFRTQIVHNKMIYKVLHDDMTKKLLTDDEQSYVEAHVPYTVVFNDESLGRKYSDTTLGEAVTGNREGWIIKPEDSYGSKGVHAGVECTQEEWENFLKENINKGYILQEFVHPYKTENVDFSKDDDWHLYSNLTGLFVYNGKFAGVYSRISACEMISTQYSEMSIPTFVVEA